MFYCKSTKREEAKNYQIIYNSVMTYLIVVDFRHSIKMGAAEVSTCQKRPL